MATMDRFKEVLQRGCLPEALGGEALTAQWKYDFLTAVHTMEEVESVTAALKKRAAKRGNLKEKLIATCRTNLQKITQKEELTAKDIEEALKILYAFRQELLPIEGEERSEKAIAKLVADGVSAGR